MSRIETKVLEGLSKRELIEIVLCYSAKRRFAAKHERLEQENANLRAQIRQLQQRVEHLESEPAQARRDSSNSSKPPSSDIVRPPKPSETSGDGKRKIGGQPGHPGHERRAFSPEEVDETHDYTLPPHYPASTPHAIIPPPTIGRQQPP